MIITPVQINIAKEQDTVPEELIIFRIPRTEKCLQDEPIGIFKLW